MNKPDPEVSRGQRTLAAIVLTDAVGFSARMSVAEEVTLNLIRRDQQLMEAICQHFEGRVLKSTGDGLLMYFASAVQAVNCSLEIQRELLRVNASLKAENPLMHRIGVHLGDVFFSQSDVMGNGVNIAARLQTEAHPGGICISKVVYDVVHDRLDLYADYAGPLQLKNIKDPIPAYHLRLDSSPIETSPTVGVNEPVVESAPGSTSREKLPPGTKVAGRYIIKRVLGQGGFGRSYLAEDSQRFGEETVLKEFFPTNKSGRSLQKALDLFKREAKTLYQINHPQVPKFLACFTQGQRLFIVQEYIDGVTYSQLLRQRRRENSRFTEAEVTQWLMHMLQVLDHLHGLKIVHRDISPDNIIYSRDRNLPILIDFGLVNDAFAGLLSGDIEEGEDDPKAATMVGKFGYSPPEQMRLGQCYPCSDLYALAVTAIVLLTGKYPRDLMDQGSLEWQWQDYVSLSQPLTDIINRMLQLRPKERFQAAREVMEVLAAIAPNSSSPLPKLRIVAPPAAATVDASFGLDAAEAVGTVPPSQSLLQDEQFIEQCRQELTRCIGPMASIVLEDALDQHPEASPQELVEVLASQLSDGDHASRFVSRVQIPQSVEGGSGSTSSSGSRLTGPGDQPSGSSPSGAPTTSQPSELTPEFINQCRQALIRCIGPMADFLVEETLADHPHLDAQGLVARLAAEIPDAAMASRFQQQMI